MAPRSEGVFRQISSSTSARKIFAVWAAHTEWTSTDDPPNGHSPAPDIADVAWFDADQAQRLLRPGQAPLLGRLEQLVDRDTG